METEERVTELENEIQATKEELKQILLDIRAFLMEAQNPLKPFEKKKIPVKSDSDEEVVKDGS